MKINVGTNQGNIQNVDTRGIRFDDLTSRVVLALALDADASGDRKIERHMTEQWDKARKSKSARPYINVNGWAVNRKRKA